MSMPATFSRQALHIDAAAIVVRLTPLLLAAVIGAELLVLATWGPDTVAVWRDPATHGDGDFGMFYENARTFSFNALYSPGLTVLMHPLTYLDVDTAFRIYVAVNVVALLGVAWVAQAGVRSPLAKVAVALGVLALPQTHWALRVGHFTEVLALAALGGLLLAERRPRTAGLLIAVLALKPQYVIVPLAYFVWSRNWRAVATCTGTLAALAVAGIAAMEMRDPHGLATVNYTFHYYLERVPWTLEYFTSGQLEQNYTQAWQYSWYGFLVSAGIEPNPLIAFDLIVLSAAAVGVVWWKCPSRVSVVATALGMLLISPHSSFYNWSMLAVAGALLLRSGIRPAYVTPLLLGGMFVAAAATQAATPWPIPVDAFRDPDTRGLYWVQPAALLTLFALAIFGRETTDEDAVGVGIRLVRGRRSALATLLHPKRFTPVVAFLRALRLPRTVAWGAGACVACIAGFYAAAYVSGSGPFEHDPYFNHDAVVAALPADFPLPARSSLEDAGAGTVYPYRIEWKTDARVNEVAGIMRTRLRDGTWRVLESTEDADGLQMKSARNGEPPVVAAVAVEPEGAGSRITVEFSPVPASSVPGYEQWLEANGIVVRNVEPEALERR